MNEAAIRVHIEPLEEGGFLATSPDVPGLIAEGRSVTEAAEIAQGLAGRIAQSCIEHGDPLPRALTSVPEAAGEFDLLVPVSVPQWDGCPDSGIEKSFGACDRSGMPLTVRDLAAMKSGAITKPVGR